jgi:hypothetical protein
MGAFSRGDYKAKVLERKNLEDNATNNYQIVKKNIKITEQKKYSKNFKQNFKKKLFLGNLDVVGQKFIIGKEKKTHERSIHLSTPLSLHI